MFVLEDSLSNGAYSGDCSGRSVCDVVKEDGSLSREDSQAGCPQTFDQDGALHASCFHLLLFSAEAHRQAELPNHLHLCFYDLAQGQPWFSVHLACLQ